MDIDRATAADLMQLAVDRGSVPMHFGAILELDPATAPDAATLRAVFGQRVRAVPRLGRLLVRTPPGCGRPVWADQPSFSPERHMDSVGLAAAAADGAAGDVEALHQIAVDAVLERLPRDRPLWRARTVVGRDGRATALVLVLHHVLADGIGGLAVLQALTDEDPRTPRPSPPGELPRPRTLAHDAWSERWHRLRTLPAAFGALARGARELGAGGITMVPPSSLLASTGPRRQIDVVEGDLATLLERAHSAGATLNDILLVAVAGALGRLLAERHEPAEHVVISVPVSSRSSTTAGQLGNQVGVMPIAVPVAVDPEVRLVAVMAQRRRLMAGPSRGDSMHVLAPTFRALAVTGAFQWFVGHQRLVHTFETNVRGPSHEIHLAGGAVRRIVPIAVNPGNVTVSFDVLSYAGRLVITVISDPEHVTDHGVLARALASELDPLSVEFR